MTPFDKYAKMTKEAMQRISQGSHVQSELNSLQDAESELQAYIASLLKRPDPSKASKIRSSKASKQRDNQRFLITYNGGGDEIIVGWSRLAKELRLKESSLRVMLSKGDNKFFRRRFNPSTGEVDIATIAKVNERGERISPKIGRPRKHFVDLERLGVEFTETDTSDLASRRKRK